MKRELFERIVSAVSATSFVDGNYVAVDGYEVARSLLRAEYYRAVENIAKEALTVSVEERDQFVHESVDGCGWVIYTGRALAVALASDQDVAEARAECGPDATPGQVAFVCMYMDVFEALYYVEGRPVPLRGGVR
jgi:hypothetical protein